VFIHDINAYPFLLVTVNFVALRQFGQLRKLIIGNSLCPQIERLEGVAILFMPGVDEFEKEKLEILNICIGIDFSDNPVVIAIADSQGPFQGLAQAAQDQLLLLLGCAAECI